MTDASETLFLSIDTTITCPACTHAFTLAQGFAQQALEKIELSTQDKLAEREARIKSDVERRAKMLGESRDNAAREEIETLKRLADEQALRHQQMLAEARTAARAQATQALAAERASLEERLAAKTVQVAALQQQEIELRNARRKLEEDQAALALEVARQVDAGRHEAEARARTQESERARLREADLQKKLDDLSEQLSIAQRKAEQGSQQLQGEVLELAVEDALRRTFPADTVEEVKKGARGGDVVHRVISRAMQPAGIILWETKRAKDWSPQWSLKLKEDMRAAGADLGVIVTMAYPKEFDAGQLFGLHDDVWVTSWSTSMHLAQVLRAGLIDVHKQRLASAGKGEKMEAVYDYLTSPQFAQKLKAVYGSFEAMRDELNKERTSTEQRWARREKQIGLAMKELVGIAGDVQGLAQQELPQLELNAEETRA